MCWKEQKLGTMSKPVFKPYEQDQLSILPPSLYELIDSQHPVKVINSVIEKIDITPLLSEYKGGGTSSYNPKMLLKVLVYSYLKNVYSSRKIEELTKENIHMMWLSGISRPDHNTINRFRSERLQKVLEEIFTQIVLLLVDSKQLSIQELYLDGTKIEANANRYTFVWKRSINYNRDKIKEQIKSLWNYAQEISDKELSEEEDEDFREIDSEKIKETIKKIDALLKDKPISKKVKQKLNYAKKHWPKNLEKYDEQEEILSERNSYSKTDEDATFMRMKDDHMQNGQLKAGYNVQISTNNQFIVNYSIHQKPNDTTTLPFHIELYKSKYNIFPEILVADAGYGSEENYQYLEDNNIDGYVKYNQFDKEQKKVRVDKKPFSQDKLYYNENEDCYICPMGQKMGKIGEQKNITENKHKRLLSLYQAKNCNGCSLRGVCHNQRTNRVIKVSHAGNYFREKAKQKLESEIGIKYRKNRSIEPEPVFGNIKQNKNLKRFFLRGIEKVKIEFGLIAIAHNLAKLEVEI